MRLYSFENIPEALYVIFNEKKTNSRWRYYDNKLQVIWCREKVVKL